VRVDSGPWPARPMMVTLVKQDDWNVPPEGVVFSIPPTPPGLEAYLVVTAIVDDDATLAILFEVLWPDSAGVPRVIHRASYARAPGYGEIIKIGKIPPEASLRIRCGYNDWLAANFVNIAVVYM